MLIKKNGVYNCLYFFDRNVERWVEDDEKGVYDEAFQWPVEKRRCTFRMPGGGTKVADVQLENHLVTVSMRVSQLKAIWEHILLPCFELPVVTPQPALKRQQNSPEATTKQPALKRRRLIQSGGRRQILLWRLAGAYLKI